MSCELRNGWCCFVAAGWFRGGARDDFSAGRLVQATLAHVVSDYGQLVALMEDNCQRQVILGMQLTVG